MKIYDLALSTTKSAPRTTGRRGDPQRPTQKGRQQVKAVTMDAFETRPALRDDLAAPTPTPNELLVRVHASSDSFGCASDAGMSPERRPTDLRCPCRT